MDNNKNGFISFHKDALGEDLGVQEYWVHQNVDDEKWIKWLIQIQKYTSTIYN